jgi:hypothetical protein
MQTQNTGHRGVVQSSSWEHTGVHRPPFLQEEVRRREDAKSVLL